MGFSPKPNPPKNKNFFKRKIFPRGGGNKKILLKNLLLKFPKINF